MNILCRLGIHRPLINREHCFVDRISGASVFRAECMCGKKWLTDSTFGWFGTKVEMEQKP